MFEHSDTKEVQKSRVEIPDIEEGMVEKMLEFIYSGQVEQIEGMEAKLLIGADKVS